MAGNVSNLRLNQGAIFAI